VREHMGFSARCADGVAASQLMEALARVGVEVAVRSGLWQMQDNDDPDAKRLYATLIRQPALSDLLPH
jgi:hypothetical protein